MKTVYLGNISSACQGLKSKASMNKQTETTKHNFTIGGASESELPNVFNNLFSRSKTGDFIKHVPALKNSLISLDERVIDKNQPDVLLKKTSRTSAFVNLHA